MDLRFDRYYTNDEIEQALRGLAAAYPALLRFEVLGQSHEGRPIHLAVITNHTKGTDTERPGFWIDGNIHATELTASMAAMYVVNDLLGGYGTDEATTRLLDEQVFYIVPRLNPDGAALAQADRPLFLRSGTRKYPYEDRADGLHQEDIDGDGLLLQMRIPDPAGDWKASDRDPRMLVKRRHDDDSGPFYRLLPEGIIQNYDGYHIKMGRSHQGLDFNRNFPAAWRPEGQQYGAGEHPGSEPEIRAVIEFFAGHPNIYAAITFHTYSRAILRPFGDKSDDEMDTTDRWTYEAFGKRGTELTGYPCISVFHHFKYHPKEVITGVFDDWLYEHKGIFAFTVELWDLPTAAGITAKNQEKRFIEWSREHPVEEDHQILDWVLAHAPDSLHAWRPFDHPQLGPLEIGGWNRMYSWRNPPHALLENEIAPQAAFVKSMAAGAPRLVWHTLKATHLGGNAYRVTAVVDNQGFLGTYGSNQAKKTGTTRPVRAELTLPDGARLLSGSPLADLGHLEGRSNKVGVTFGVTPTDNRGVVEWLVEAPAGTTVGVTVDGARAGVLRGVVELTGS